MSERPHHRPAMPGAMHFESVEGGPDPAVLRDAAERAAVALVRGTTPADDAVVARVIVLAESEGLESLAELWASAAPDSVAGTLWRLYLLRTWVHANPVQAASEFGEGRSVTPVAEAVAGVAEPPGPDEVRRLVDEVLAGVVRGEYADVLFRAAAFARVTAAGRARSEQALTASGSTYAADLSAARLLTMSEQLEHAAHLELAGHLG
ncbi:MAG: hypothetical protein ACR2FG_01125 [Marmoricola sp.]